MGSLGNSGILSRDGLSDRFLNIGSNYKEWEEFNNKDWAKLRAGYTNLLVEAGVYGTEEQIEEAIDNHEMWHDIERTRLWGEDSKEVDAETWLATEDYTERYNMYMSREEFRKLLFSAPNYLRVEGTLSEGLEKYWHGGKSARLW